MPDTYNVIKNMRGIALITAAVEVKQGYSMSRLLFIIVLRHWFYSGVKKNCEPHGFLSLLLFLIIMNNIVHYQTARLTR